MPFRLLPVLLTAVALGVYVHGEDSAPASDETADASGAPWLGEGPQSNFKLPPESGPEHKLKVSVRTAAETAALAALEAARAGKDAAEIREAKLPTEGKPGDVRLVCCRTNVIQRSRWVVPKVPLPPFTTWNAWLDEHPYVTHCSLDWMDDQGQWWHTELRAYDQYPDEYRVGEGEFRATGTTVYGIFIVPGRTVPKEMEVLLDERIDADYRKLAEVAREYARKDKRRGEPGTGGRGERNVGLGGPAWRPSCNSNTYISYILRRVGIEREKPEGAIGWERIPSFPYSSDADAYGR